MSGTPCHSCGAIALRPIEDFHRLHRVTSDCRPWPGHGELAVCADCGLVQKPVTAAWRAEAAAVYADYHMYYQASGEAEQKVASDAGFQKRSDFLLSWAKSTLPLAESGRYLDFGCGNGATLRSAAQVLPGWDLFGYEPHVRDRQSILAIPGVKGLLTELDGQEGTFDLITMMHVVEHIPDPSATLGRVAKALAPHGRLFIQVPYFIDSPYELTVADHCSHFTVQSLARVVSRAGLAIVSASSDVLKREITLIAARSDKAPSRIADEPCDVELLAAAAAAQVAWLSHLVDDARAAVHRPFGIFGTAIAGSWLYSHLPDVTDFFVDEDASRAGQQFLGCPVYLPSQVPSGAVVYVALIPELARKIRERHSALAVDWRVPPDWRRPDVEPRGRPAKAPASSSAETR